MSERHVIAPPSPYKGLAPFEDSPIDALFFFGRERESEIVAANLMAYRLTVLYGGSGVGKSSLLRAGVTYRLRQAGEAVVVFDSWSGEPVSSLLDVARETLELPPHVDPADAPAGALSTWTAALGRELYLILDQFDEYFLYHEDGDEFARALAEVVTHPGLRLNILISIRDDMLSQLDRFKALIPNLFSNYLRLDHLDREAARASIVGPLDRFNALVAPAERVTAEPELVDAVLDGSGSDGRIETPFLQLVMQRLWEEERSSGSQTLRLETLERLGGAREIVRAHLDDALEGLSPTDRELAAKLFNHLVTPSGTKIAHGLGDLAQYASASEGEVASVLATLVDERILRPVSAPGDRDGAQYEIFHDVLAEPVTAWRSRHDAERDLERANDVARRRHRRLLILTVLALLVAAVMTAATVFAVTQRQDARKQAKRAHVRALLQSALATLPVNPERSLQLALDAAKSSSSPETEGVLRKVLLQEYERARLPGEGVRALAFNPAGGQVATAGAAGKVRLFSLPEARVERTLTVAGPLQKVAFDSAGRLVAAGGTSGIVRIWNASNGAVVATLRHKRAVTDVSFGYAGRLVVTASRDGTARLWRTDGTLVRTFRHPGQVGVAVLNRQGTVLATVAKDRQKHSLVRIFDAHTGRLIRTLPEKGMRTIAFSPDGRILATGSADKTARLWDARTGGLLHAPLQHHGHVLDVAFSPDGKLLATASADGGTWVWEVATGTRYLVRSDATNPTMSVDFSRDGRFLVSSSLDRSARVFALGNLEGKLVAQLVGHRGGVTSAAFSPNGRLVGTVGEFGAVRLWDPDAEDQLRVVRSYPGRAVTTASMAPDGRLLVAVGREVQVGPKVLRFPSYVTSAGFARDGRLVFVAYGDKVVLLRPDTGAVVARIRTPKPVDGVAVSPDASLIATGEDGDVVQLWQVETGSVVARLPGRQFHPAFSPDGKTLATADADDAIRIWDVPPDAPRHVLRGHTNDVNDVEFSPDGRLLVTASSDDDVRVWDPETGKKLHRLIGQFGAVKAASFSPDGRWVVSAGPTTAILWQPAEHLFFYLRGHSAMLTSASFAPDGRRIVTSSIDGTVRSYDCQVCVGLDGLIALGEARLARLRGG